MIRLQDLTPDVYYKQSRDFQLIGRLYDLVLNYTKTNTTLVNNVILSDNTDTQLIDLLATTLGFKAVHTYNVKQLVSVCSCLSEILKNKGTKKAIELAVYAILNAEGIFLTEQVNLDDLVRISYQTDEPESESKPTRELEIVIPAQMQDTTLLRDLLDYILPAGFSARFIRSAITYTPGATDYFCSEDNVIASNIGTAFMSKAAKAKAEPENYKQYDAVNPGYIVGNFVNSAVWRATDSKEEPNTETT